MKFKLPRIVPNIPPHPRPRDWRAAVALVASIFGSVAFTLFSAAMVYILWKGGWAEDTAVQRLDYLGKALMLSLAGSLLVLITLGLAINRRSVKLGKDGFEASGGDDEESEADNK